MSTINVTSVIAASDHRPFVQMMWGNEKAQFTPEEARLHAYGILEAADAAESDAIMVGFLEDKLGKNLDNQSLSVLLNDFRELRQRTKYTISDGMNRSKFGFTTKK